MTLPGVYSLPGLEFRIEASIGLGDDGGTYLYDNAASLYDDVAVYSAREFFWQDIRARFISATCTRGRDTIGTRVRPGTATIVVEDSDGIFNPDYSTLQIGQQTLRPGKWMRISGKPVADAEWVPLFTGRIDVITEDYSGAGHAARAVFTLTDYASTLERTKPPGLVTPVGAGELTSDRVDRILKLQGFTPDDLAGRIDTGIHTMQETTLAESRNAECQKAAQAEGSAFYMLADGLPRFRAYGWLDDDPLTPEGAVQYSIGALADEVQITNDPSASWASARVRNDIQLARKGGSALFATDNPSQSAYGQRSFQLYDYENDNDVDLQKLADDMLVQFRYDRLRLGSLNLVPLTGAAARQIMETDVGWRVKVNINLQARGWGYSFDAWVQRITHELREGGDWVPSLIVDTTDLSDPQAP